MAITQAARSALYVALVRSIGEGPTETLMAALPAFAPPDVATKSDLVHCLAPINRSLAALRTDMDRVLNEFGAVTERCDEIIGECNRRVPSDGQDAVHGAIDRGFAASVQGMDAYQDAANERFDEMNRRLDMWWTIFWWTIGAVITATIATSSSERLFT